MGIREERHLSEKPVVHMLSANAQDQKRAGDHGPLLISSAPTFCILMLGAIRTGTVLRNTVLSSLGEDAGDLPELEKDAVSLAPKGTK